jgi:hypothetical protein
MTHPMRAAHDPTRPRRWRRRLAALVVAAVGSGVGTSVAAPSAHATPTARAATAAPLAVGSTDVVKLALTPDGTGAYLLSAGGSVTPLGAATTYGSSPQLQAGERLATMVATAHGYLLFSDRGRVFAYGDAVARGDLAGTPLNGPIVDAAATIDGLGYWLLGSDGGVFSFGSARFSGSTGDLRLNSPANGIVPDADGTGYWFVAGDGGVFAFDAPFRGSMGATPLNRPVVGMIPYGDGYLLLGADGGVFAFSDRPFHGSLGATPQLTATFPIASIAAGPGGDFYVLARRDGTLYGFGPGTPAWAQAAALPPACAPGAPVVGCSPAAGNPDGHAAVPADAQAVDTSHPDHVIGDGTPASCTSAAVVAAVAQGGIITFSCGPDPVTIVMEATARIRNDTGPVIVLDGGNLVTLSGGGQRRILYMNTCDRAQVWTTSHCQDQDHPRLTVQNLTFVDGNATGETVDGGGGGAIFVRGGRVKIVHSRFFRNVCDPTGPDVAGGAVRVLSQSQGLPVSVVDSTFGGAPGYGNACSNGGGLSSIGVSWTVLNSTFSHNTAIGIGANPARAGTPGGGNGGAICLDGNQMTLRVDSTLIQDNGAREGGGAIFFVSNNRTGTMRIDGSLLQRNPSDRFETAGFPGIFFLGSGLPVVVDSILRP